MQSKLNRLFRKLVIFGFLPVTYFFLTSCEDPKDIGLNLSASGQIATSFTDTVSVDASTMLLDSAVTSGSSTVLAGSYSDPVFGPVETKSYFQVNLAGSSLYSGYFDSFDIQAAITATDATINAVYDSAGVYVKYSGFKFGKDTLQDLTLTLYPMLEPVNPSPVNYISSNSLHYDETNPIASQKITIRDLKNVSGDTLKTLQFVLPNSFGKQLYDLSGKMSNTINYTDGTGTTTQVEVGDNDKFHNFLQGFALVAKRGPNVVYSFNLSSSYMYVAYHYVRNGVPLDVNNTEVTDTTQYQTSIYRHIQQFLFSGGRFSQIKVNRQGTSLAKVTQALVSVPTSQTGGKTFYQNGAGITTKLKMNITSLQNLAKLGKITINKAELILSTPIDSLNNIYPPTYVSLVELDKSNLMVKSPSTGILYLPSEVSPTAGQITVYDAINKRYLFNVTTYIQDIIANRRNTDGLMLAAAIPNSGGYAGGLSYSNVSRAVFDDKSIKLRVYYSTTK